MLDLGRNQNNWFPHVMAYFSPMMMMMMIDYDDEN